MSTEQETESLKPETGVYCDECVPVKHWMTAVPYVNVKLCPTHARTFPSESDKTLLRLALERLDDGSVWAEESEGFAKLKALIERLTK